MGARIAEWDGHALPAVRMRRQTPPWTPGPTPVRTCPPWPGGVPPRRPPDRLPYRAQDRSRATDPCGTRTPTRRHRIRSGDRTGAPSLPQLFGWFHSCASPWMAPAVADGQLAEFVDNGEVPDGGFGPRVLAHTRKHQSNGLPPPPTRPSPLAAGSRRTEGTGVRKAVATRVPPSRASSAGGPSSGKRVKPASDPVGLPFPAQGIRGVGTITGAAASHRMREPPPQGNRSVGSLRQPRRSHDC